MDFPIKPAVTKPARKWRLAFFAIYSSRALFARANEIISQKQRKRLAFRTGILPTPSHVAIHIDPSTPNYKSIIEMVEKKDLTSLNEFGGVEGVAKDLHSDPKNGICGDPADIRCRSNAFGSNSSSYKLPKKGLCHFVLKALMDKTFLTIFALSILSLGIGIKQHGVQQGLQTGGSLFVAAVLVVTISGYNNFRRSSLFNSVSVCTNIQVNVVRDGKPQVISISATLVGDIVYLRIGDLIPADGLFIDGHSLEVNELSMSGEMNRVEIDEHNPFLFYGSEVVDGYGRMLVTTVGTKTACNGIMSTFRRDTINDRTPLQAKLEKLTSYNGKIGLAVVVVIVVMLWARYFTGNTKDENGNREFNGRKTNFMGAMNAILRTVAAAVTVPEILPFAATLTLAYSMKRMVADKVMIRKVSACETMALATTLCINKTGILTLNEMTVAKFWIAGREMPADASRRISHAILELLDQGVGLNTGGNIYGTEETGLEISGTPTEKALLRWAVFDMGRNIGEMKRNCSILHSDAINPEEKINGILLKKNDDNTLHEHWKGAAEIIIGACSNYYEHNGLMKDMNNSMWKTFKHIIQDMAAESLRCIAFAHKQITEGFDRVEDGLTLLGFVGIKDPCRPRMRTVVDACKDAGLSIKMITGDHVFTAVTVAVECGILEPKLELDRGAVVEGVEFRNYTHEERMEEVEKICVMANSSPQDKLLMVECLKQKGHVVAVTGKSIKDAPALEVADIGLSMGIQGAGVINKNSDIVILDDSFASVAQVLQWARCVHNNIQRFIQFQLTMNVADLMINFIAAVSAVDIPLTAVQLLWVYLIMYLLVALALVTEKPTKELMEKPPVGRSESLLTNVVWRNLIAQSLYQMAVRLTLQLKGEAIFGVNEKVRNALIFNTFVFCQIFNVFNVRKLEKKNVFKGIQKNKSFMGTVGITIFLQVVMMEFLKRFGETESLNWKQWGACIGLAAISWPIAWAAKCIPVPDHKPLIQPSIPRTPLHRQQSEKRLRLSKSYWDLHLALAPQGRWNWKYSVLAKR